MNTSLSLEVVQQSIITFSYILAFSVLGAVCKDYYELLIRKCRKVKLGRIFVSAITGAIVVYGVSNYILSRGDTRILTVFSYVAGLVGFELIGKLGRLKHIKEFIEYILEFKVRVKKIEEVKKE